MRRVRIVNLRNGRVLADRAEVADRFLTRLRGLLGRRGLPPGTGLVILPAFAVHGFGMRFAIDVAHVDRHGRVVRTCEPLRPGRLSLAAGGRLVVELPAGTLAETETRAGDRIALQPLPGRDQAPGGVRGGRWQRGQ